MTITLMLTIWLLMAVGVFIVHDIKNNPAMKLTKKQQREMQYYSMIGRF